MLIAVGYQFPCPSGYWSLIDTCVTGFYHPTSYDYRCQSTDSFIASFSADGTRLWATYYGDYSSELSTCLHLTGDGDTISVAGITTNFNYPVIPYKLSSTYTYLKDGGNYWSLPHTGVGCGYAAQFNSSGGRSWGTYFPKAEDVSQTNFGRWRISDTRHLNHEVVICGTTNESGGYLPDYPPNAFMNTYCMSEIDTIIKPLNASICQGDSLLLTIGAITSPPRDLNYSWMKDGLAIPGANDSVLWVHSNPSDTGWYSYRITQGYYSLTDSVNVSSRQKPGFQKLPFNTAGSPISDVRNLCDLNQNHWLDVISGNRICYNDSVSFNSFDSIPALYPEISVVDLYNDGNPFIFSRMPYCSGTWPIDCTKPVKLIRKVNNQTQVIENDLLDGVSAWGDFDNDGIVEGFKIKYENLDIAKLYLVKIKPDTVFENFAGTVPYSMWAVCTSRMHVADYDHDGDLDILFTGTSNDCGWNLFTSVLLNDHGSFHDIQLPFIAPLRDGSMSWFDADADGNLDIAYCFTSYVSSFSPFPFGKIITVYRHEDDIFTKIFTDTIQIYSYQEIQRPLLFDYDNDGFCDIVLKKNIYRYNGSSYTLAQSKFGIAHTGLTEDAVAFGDIDGDGDVDIISSDKIFRNDVCNPPNTLPTSPPGLNSVVSKDTVRVYWQRASDLETPQMGLTYSLRVGTTPGGSQVMSAMSDESGWRKVTGMGNVTQNTGWWLHKLQPGKYYWSVQAIDNSFAGGPFAPEQTFTIYPDVPVSVTLSDDTIINGQTLCFDATQTILVGGNGSKFTIQNGGSVLLIAGEKILMLPSVKVETDGYLHGYITSNNEYCFQVNQPSAMVTAKGTQELMGTSVLLPEKSTELPIKAFPNPTSGMIYLTINSPDQSAPVRISLYNSYGENLLTREISGRNMEPLSLEQFSPGLYILFAVQGEKRTLIKVVRI